MHSVRVVSALSKKCYRALPSKVTPVPIVLRSLDVTQVIRMQQRKFSSVTGCVRRRIGSNTRNRVSIRKQFRKTLSMIMAMKISFLSPMVVFLRPKAKTFSRMTMIVLIGDHHQQLEVLVPFHTTL